MNRLSPRLIDLALGDVIDPEVGRSVVELGLIYDVDVSSDGVVRIIMTTTTRGCPLSGFLKEAVATAAGAVEGVSSVEVMLTWEPPWTPALIPAE